MQLAIEGWRIDVAARTAKRGDQESQLSPRAIRLLQALVDANGAVVSRAELLDRVWPNVIVSDESLTQVVSELRRLFGRGRDGAPVIQTIPKSGYRIAVTVLTEVTSTHTQSPREEGSFDLEAYRLCLEARSILSRSGPGSLEHAEYVAREAAERAPAFAMAQAEHAIMLVQRNLYRQGGAFGLQQALERAEASVKLQPRLAIAQAALGYALGAVERWADAKRAFSRALHCDHTDAEVHYLAARTLFAARDYPGATALAEQAAALDGDNFRPLYLASRAAAAFDPSRTRRLGEHTLRRVRARLETDPYEPRALNTLGPLMAHLGEFDSAMAAMDADSATGSPLEFYDLVARALMGDTEGALQTFEAIADRGWCHPAWLSAEPALANLNDHPRFQRIARQLGAA